MAEIIGRDPTQAVITGVTPAPAQFGQTVTLTATIKAVGGGLIAPVGSVTFTDSYTVGGITTNTTLGTVTLPSVSAGVTQAQATFTTASLAQHPHTLKAIYNGDTAAPFPLPASFPFRGEWLPSTSLGYGFVVQGDKTTGTLSANPSGGRKEGATVTFVDSLKATAGGTVFGGVVTFKDGTRVLGVTSVDIRGRASLLTSIAGPGGTHSITAFYAGSANFNASTSNTLLYAITPSGANTASLNTASAPGVQPLPDTGSAPPNPRHQGDALPAVNPSAPIFLPFGESVDEFFVSTAKTVRPAVRLAGALIKRRLDDWSSD